MEKKNFYLPDQQIQALKALAKETGITVSEHIRRAIDEYLKRLRNEAGATAHLTSEERAA